MSGAYTFSAADSVTGAIYTWGLSTLDFSGAGYTGPNSPVNQRLVSPLPGLPGTSSGAQPIAVMIDSPNNVNLAAGPTTWQGYALQVGDIVGMRLQTTTANNRLYTYTSSGVFTPLATQPPDGAQLVTLKGSVPYQLFIYQPTVISPLNAASAGTVTGANGTVITYAPDPAGGSNKRVGNEAIDVTALTAATPAVLYQYDFAGRNFTSGTICFKALVLLKTNSGKAAKLEIETVLFAGSPPTFHNDSQQYDVDDASGAGGYGPLVWSIVGNVLKLTITPSLTGSCVGLVSFLGGTI